MDMDSQAAAAPAPATADNKLGKKAAAAHGRQGRPHHRRTSGARWLSNDPKPQSTFTNPFSDITNALLKHCQCCRSTKPQQTAARP